MKSRPLALLAVCAAGALAAPAFAEPVGLLAQTGMISGSQSFVFALQVTTPGMLTVSLADLNWQGRLSDLSFSLSGSQGLLSQLQSDRSRVLPSAAGTGSNLLSDSLQLFEVTAPGTYYAYVSGTAGGRYGLGLFGLNATLAPSAVPLPAAAWLLLAGLGGIAGVARKRLTPFSGTAVFSI